MTKMTRIEKWTDLDRKWEGEIVEGVDQMNKALFIQREGDMAQALVVEWELSVWPEPKDGEPPIVLTVSPSAYDGPTCCY